MFKFYKKLSGFSVLEVVIAILIIAMGMVGVLSLIIQNVRVQYINRHALVASQLAQEGLGLARNVRDKNWLVAGNDWKTGTTTDANTDIVQDGDYAIDYEGDIIDLDDINDPGANLKISAGGYYWHGVGDNSNYNRLIEVVDQGDNINVKCTVQWQEKNNKYDYVAETELYNWR